MRSRALQAHRKTSKVEKEALRLFVLGRFWEGGADRRANLIDASADPEVRLRDHFKAYAEIVINQDFQKGCMIGNFSVEMARNDDVRARLKNMYKTWVGASPPASNKQQRQGNRSLQRLQK